MIEDEIREQNIDTLETDLAIEFSDLYRKFATLEHPYIPSEINVNSPTGRALFRAIATVIVDSR